jgi:hypothetical protein
MIAAGELGVFRSVAVECPTCRYPVPAEWSMCRRCGAPLHSVQETTRVAVPSTMHRKRNGIGLATQQSPAAQSSLAAVAAAARNGPHDTLLPGALPRPDNLLPRPTRSAPTPPPAPTPSRESTRRPKAKRTRRGRRKRAPLGTRVSTSARKHWRRILVLLVVGVALTMSLIAAWPVVFSTDNHPNIAPSSAAQELVATGVLRTVVGGGRSLYAPRNSFAQVTPTVLSAYSYRVPVVGPKTVAHIGTVSLQVNSPAVLTLATPVQGGRCVFARDEPTKARTLFLTVRTASCRASAAPTRGWKRR